MFFDFANPHHSGQGYKKLFALRNEELPNEFKATYRSAKKTPKKYEDLMKPYQNNQPQYESEPLPQIPHFFTQPNKITIWSTNETTGNKEKMVIPATVYTYKDKEGRRIGFILRGVDPATKQKIIRPLTVWNRILDNDKVLPCYRQKAFEPTLYNLDVIAAHPEKIVIVVEGEKCAKYGTLHGALQYNLPIIFTTWPFGVQSYNSQKLWDDLNGEINQRILLWPDNDEIGIQVMKEIKSRYLKKALILDPKQIGLKEKEDIADLPVGLEFKQILENLIQIVEEKEKNEHKRYSCLL